MSSGVVVKANELRKCLMDIHPLFPKGSYTLPILFSLTGSNLTIVCTAGCTYSATLKVVEQDVTSWEITVLYKSLIDFVPGTGLISFDHKPYGLTLTGNDFEVQLPTSYSIVSAVELPKVQFTEVSSNGYVKGLNNLINMRLGDLYQSEKPVTLYDQLAVLKYPNMQIQARALGLHLLAVMTPEHLKLLTRFEPKEVYCDNVSSVILKRNDAFLILPMKPAQEENKFVELLEGMSEPITLDVEHYIDKLRNMLKANNKGRCKIVFHENGISSSISQDNIVIKSGLGDTSGRVTKALYLPIQLWVKMVNALGNSNAQFMYGSETICLRTQSIIIVVRALL